MHDRAAVHMAIAVIINTALVLCFTQYFNDKFMLNLPVFQNGEISNI